MTNSHTSTTPIFDEALRSHPRAESLWLSGPKVFPWPSHFSECPFDGYNWHVCTCPHVQAQITALYDMSVPELKELVGELDQRALEAGDSVTE